MRAGGECVFRHLGGRRRCPPARTGRKTTARALPTLTELLPRQKLANPHNTATALQTYVDLFCRR
eukprot:1887890-Lingulodinium_polyedra.AAC.1